MGHSDVKDLLRFVDFLTTRLYSENLELLRRIVREFHETPRGFTTVQDLVRVGFPTVYLVPVDNEDPVLLDMARSELRRVRRGHVQVKNVRALRQLFEGLRHRIALVNWEFLLPMYSDFCIGTETALRGYITHGKVVIAVRPMPAVGAIRSIKDEETIKDEDGVHSDEEMETSEPESSLSPSDHEMEMARDKHNLASEEDEMDIDRTVFEAQRRVERTAPWKHVFNVAHIEYPFDPSAYADLAARFITFWEHHAHAVWERSFWPPLPDMAERSGTAYYERKHRQQKAVDAFHKFVVDPIYRTLGARFFVSMDATHERLHWWWLRTPVVDLRKMANDVGVEACVKYINTQSHQRFPKVPAAFTTNDRVTKMPSMWIRKADAMDKIAAIEKLKKKKKRALKKRQSTRATAASRDANDDESEH